MTLSSFVNALNDALRNLMLASVCGPTSDLIELPETQKQDLAAMAARFTLPVLVQAVGICQQVARTVKGSSVARALVEAALIRLAESDKFVDTASLVERIEQLGQTGLLPSKKKKLADNRAASPADANAPQSQGRREESAAPEAPVVKAAPVALSTEEKHAARTDPAVQAIIQLFDGECIDVQREDP